MINIAIRQNMRCILTTWKIIHCFSQPRFHLKYAKLVVDPLKSCFLVFHCFIPTSTLMIPYFLAHFYLKKAVQTALSLPIDQDLAYNGPFHPQSFSHLPPHGRPFWLRLLHHPTQRHRTLSFRLLHPRPNCLVH